MVGGARLAKGFTLIEILIVISIIAILGTVAFNQIVDFRREAKIAAATQIATSMNSGIKNQSVQARLRCGVLSNTFPPLSSIQANDIGSGVGALCTTSNISNSTERRFVDLASFPPVNPVNNLSTIGLADNISDDSYYYASCTASAGTEYGWCYRRNDGYFFPSTGMGRVIAGGGGGSTGGGTTGGGGGTTGGGGSTGGGGGGSSSSEGYPECTCDLDAIENTYCQLGINLYNTNSWHLSNLGCYPECACDVDENEYAYCNNGGLFAGTAHYKVTAMECFPDCYCTSDDGSCIWNGSWSTFYAYRVTVPACYQNCSCSLDYNVVGSCNDSNTVASTYGYRFAHGCL